MIDRHMFHFHSSSVVTCSFSQNSSIHEGLPAELMIVCDQAPITNITLNVTTMDITATCEWKVVLHGNMLCNNGVTSELLFVSTPPI